MRFRAILLFILTALVLCGGALTAHAAETAKFQIGQITVWSIADAIGERDLSVFNTDAETIAKYVPSGKSQSGVLALVVKTDNEIILIDTGYGRDTSLLLPGLADIGLNPRDITTVLITHLHGDHMGGLIWQDKKAFPRANVLIGANEYDFWFNPQSREKFPDRQANFDMAERIADMYKNYMYLFEFGDAVAPGITALNAAGHTPGHSAFMIESDGERLLCVADLLHSVELQLPRPDINASYDMMPRQAAVARERILKRAAAEGLPIAGMHLPFPGIGRVQKAYEGYRYLPGLK